MKKICYCVALFFWNHEVSKSVSLLQTKFLNLFGRRKKNNNSFCIKMVKKLSCLYLLWNQRNSLVWCYGVWQILATLFFWLENIENPEELLEFTNKNQTVQLVTLRILLCSFFPLSPKKLCNPTSIQYSLPFFLLVNWIKVKTPSGFHSFFNGRQCGWDK